eukprot:g11935.t1
MPSSSSDEDDSGGKRKSDGNDGSSDRDQSSSDESDAARKSRSNNKSGSRSGSNSGRKDGSKSGSENGSKSGSDSGSSSNNGSKSDSDDDSSGEGSEDCGSGSQSSSSRISLNVRSRPKRRILPPVGSTEGQNRRELSKREQEDENEFWSFLLNKNAPEQADEVERRAGGTASKGGSSSSAGGEEDAEELPKNHGAMPSDREPGGEKGHGRRDEDSEDPSDGTVKSRSSEDEKDAGTTSEEGDRSEDGSSEEAGSLATTRLHQGKILKAPGSRGGNKKGRKRASTARGADYTSSSEDKGRNKRRKKTTASGKLRGGYQDPFATTKGQGGPATGGGKGRKKSQHLPVLRRPDRSKRRGQERKKDQTQKLLEAAQREDDVKAALRLQEAMEDREQEVLQNLNLQQQASCRDTAARGGKDGGAAGKNVFRQKREEDKRALRATVGTVLAGSCFDSRGKGKFVSFLQNRHSVRDPLSAVLRQGFVGYVGGAQGRARRRSAAGGATVGVVSGATVR